MKHIASVSFGKDSLAMLLMLIEKYYPLDEVVFYDTGKEFQAIYNLRDKIQTLCADIDIKFTQIDADPSFDYKMFETPVCKRGTKEVHKHGYSWCGGTCRWGTTDKLAAIDRHCIKQYGKGNFIQYVGIAADESERLEKEYKIYKAFPLVEWEMSEQECLAYCYQDGYNWFEKTDSGKMIDLYTILKRVSCWCCRNKNLAELKNYYKHFYTTYWQGLKDIQERLPEPMKQSGSVFELEERFERELAQMSFKGEC